jgi:hypothetical protein
LSSHMWSEFNWRDTQPQNGKQTRRSQICRAAFSGWGDIGAWDDEKSSAT